MVNDEFEYVRKKKDDTGNCGLYQPTNHILKQLLIISIFSHYICKSCQNMAKLP